MNFRRTDPINLLCDLAEASGDEFQAAELLDKYGAPLRLLIDLDALRPGALRHTVTCRACHGDHPATVNFDAATRRHIHFCPEAGFVTVDDADLATFQFDPGWLVEWLMHELPIPSPGHRRAIVPDRAWHLGDAICGNTTTTVIFARRVTSHAAIDQLASALCAIPPAPVGLVVTSSSEVPRRVRLLHGYEFLDLREIGRSAEDRLFLDNAKLASWVKGFQSNARDNSPVADRSIGATGTRRRDPSRLDYRAADRPLIEEMRSMILRGEARNATDAARAVARHAAGSGKEASKVTRLAAGYFKKYPLG